MSELHRLPQHRVRADGRVHVVHHDDGGRTIYDERGLPDRYVPPSVTWAQWRPRISQQRRRAFMRGYRLGRRDGRDIGALLGGSLMLALCVFAGWLATRGWPP